MESGEYIVSSIMRLREVDEQAARGESRGQGVHKADRFTVFERSTRSLAFHLKRLLFAKLETGVGVVFWGVVFLLLCWK